MVAASRLPPYRIFRFSDDERGYGYATRLILPEPVSGEDFQSNLPLIISSVVYVAPTSEFWFTLADPASDYRLMIATDWDINIKRSIALPAVMAFLSAEAGRYLASRTINETEILLYRTPTAAPGVK